MAPPSDAEAASAPPTLAAIRAAADRLGGLVARTPLVAAPSLSRDSDRRAFVKLENRQVAGCFKPRGALNFVLAAVEDGRTGTRAPLTGLVTASSGNHGQAVALAAAHVGLPCLVVAPEDVTALKRDAIVARGATVELRGLTSAERLERAGEVARDRGWSFVPPFDDARIVAGQGTAGLEIAGDAPDDAVAVVVPVGGGGLVAGVGLALAAARPGIALVGVEPDDADDAARSLASGTLLSNEAPSRSACDGLRNTRLGVLNWRVLSELRPSMVAVTDAQVEHAARLLEDDGLGPVEPSGAAAAAAILAGRVARAGEVVVALVSGGNAARDRG